MRWGIDKRENECLDSYLIYNLYVTPLIENRERKQSLKVA